MIKKEKLSMNIVLWVVQGLLALSCVFSGLSKAFLPLAHSSCTY